MVDTIPKRNRKEFLENEMKKLEKDIDILEKHDIIYIGNWKHVERLWTEYLLVQLTIDLLRSTYANLCSRIFV